MNVRYDLSSGFKPCVFCNDDIKNGSFCKRCVTDD